MADKPMHLLEHLEELRVRLIRVLWVTLPIFLFIITFEVHFTWWNGLPVPVGLGLDPFSALASQVYRFMIRELVPSYIEPTQLTPAQALSVQFKISGFLTLVLAMPVLAYEGWMFISPALYHNEKKLIAKVVLPATLLFIAGAIFAYFIILPFAFSWLYSIGAGLGARRYILSLDDFLDIVLIVMAAMGVAFQTPLIMWGLSSIGLVQPVQWRRWWRYAVIAFFVFGAVVTPDGSGVTMILVALPMTALYLAGMGLAQSTARKDGRPKPRRPRRVVAASVAAVVIVAGVGFLYLDSQLPVPARVAAVELGGGVAILETPVMTFYSLPPGRGLNSSTTAVLAETSSLIYRWDNVSLGGARVVFQLDSTGAPSVVPGPGANTFRFFPGRTQVPSGPIILGSQAGRAGMLSTAWLMHFSVAAKEQLSGSRVVDRWVELTYRLVHPVLRFQDLPAANISLPNGPDLVLAGTWSIGSLGGTDLRLGLEDVGVSGRAFGGLELGPTLSTTTGERIPTHLTSTFLWGAGDRYAIDLHASADFRGSIVLSWDVRFGSLVPRLA